MRFLKTKVKSTDLEIFLTYCLSKNQEKLSSLQKILTSSELEKLDTDTWESFYLSLSHIVGEREKLKYGQSQIIGEMLNDWSEILTEKDEEKNLILRGKLIRLAGISGENEHIYCPHSTGFRGNPLNQSLHEFGKFEEWHKNKILGEIQKEVVRLSSLLGESNDIEEAINYWVGFYNFLSGVKIGQEGKENLYSWKIKMASLNLGDDTLGKDINTFLREVPSVNKIEEMNDILFYQMGRSWNRIFLSLLESRAKMILRGQKKKEEAPVSELLNRWKLLGENIGKGGEVEEKVFQKYKMDIVYYAAYSSYFLSAPAKLKSSIFNALSWFVDSHTVLNAPAHRIHSLNDEWSRVLLLLESFQAEKELATENEGKDILISLEELLPLWSEFEELIRTESYDTKDEERFDNLRLEILKSYSPILPVVGTKFLNERNLLSYASIPQIKNLPSFKQLLYDWHEHYIKLHNVLDDCLAKEKNLNFELMRENLENIITSWRKLGISLGKGAGELKETKKEVYEQFKVARKEVPVLSDEGVKIINFLASIPRDNEWNKMPDDEKSQIIIRWDKILTGLYYCCGEVEALEDRQKYEWEEQRYKNKVMRGKKLRRKLRVVLLIVLFMAGTGFLYKKYREYHKEFIEKITYRPWQREAALVNYSFKVIGNEPVLGMAKDMDKLWVLTENGNLKIYSLAGRKTESISIPSNSQARCIYVDSNFVWVGTQEQILRLDKLMRTWGNLGGDKGISCKNITTIIFKDWDMWIGTSKGKGWEGGIVSYNTLSGETRHYTKGNGLPGDDITALRIVGNSIWAGTKAGIGIYDGEKWEKISEYGSISSIALDESFVWLGGLGKVYVLDMNKGVWKTHPVKEGLGCWINDIFVQKDYVWLATGGAGLIRYGKYDNTWRSFNSKRNNLISDSLQKICGQTDRMWLSSAALFGGGVTEITARKIK